MCSYTLHRMHQSASIYRSQLKFLKYKVRLFLELNKYTVPSRHLWDCGRWKSDSLWNFSIVGCQFTGNCLLGVQSSVIQYQDAILWRYCFFQVPNGFPYTSVQYSWEYVLEKARSRVDWDCWEIKGICFMFSTLDGVLCNTLMSELRVREGDSFLKFHMSSACKI